MNECPITDSPVTLHGDHNMLHCYGAASHHNVQEQKEHLPQQLCLFHWWNAYPDNVTYGADASRLPVHEGGFVEGRSGFQWIKAAIHYLEYRAGSAWRTQEHRYHPVRWHYTECIRLLNEAYYKNVKWWSPAAPHVHTGVPKKGAVNIGPRKEASTAHGAACSDGRLDSAAA